MGMWIGRNRKARVTYGFDEIALVPGLGVHHSEHRRRRDDHQRVAARHLDLRFGNAEPGNALDVRGPKEGPPRRVIEELRGPSLGIELALSPSVEDEDRRSVGV